MPIGVKPSYWLTRFVFQKLLAFIYLIAFAIAFFQFCPLVGQHGILPVKGLLQQVHFWDAPSIFWLHPTDHAFKAIALAGIVLAALAVTGLSEAYGLFFSVAVWSLLWVLYLSFVNFGQLFYGYGWEDLLLETGFLAIFLGSADTAVPVVLMWFLRWLLFRLMFGAGLIKIRGDECWRNLSCMEYHYQTQPLPNPLSWYLYKLPAWYHKMEVLFNHFIELIVPWGFFFKVPLRYVAGGLTIFFQCVLILSGNLSFLNYLAITIAMACFDDRLLSRFIPIKPPAVIKPMGLARKIIISLLSVMIILLSIRPLINMISPRQVMNASFDSLHLVNTYGAFGSVSKQRFEVVIEGTDDAAITSQTQWKEYTFKCNPGDPYRAPCIVSPYHYRLDWQMWFASMSDFRYHPWVLSFVEKLLENDKAVLGLMAINPFPDHPPQYIRAQLYEYHFTSFAERRKTGRWWDRTLIGEYLPPLSLDDPGYLEILQRAGWLDKNYGPNP